MFNFLLFALVASSLLVSPNVWAEEDGSYLSYDAIVNELKTSSHDVPQPVTADADWEDVAIHGGIGFATSYVTVVSPDGSRGSGLLKGLQLNFGVNLFTRSVRAEGAFSSYQQEELDHNLKADLKEFELRLIYLPLAQEGINLRLGFGLAARYMGLDSNLSSGWANYRASTPSSFLLLGFERKLSKNLAMGPDISYRSAVVSDTFDKSAWDASFRLNATF